MFDGGWWSVWLPHGWCGRPEKQGASFQRRPAIGTLQISCARKDARVADEDLKEFARERLVSGVRLVGTDCGLFTGFFAEHKREGLFWREWWLRYDRLLIYATYVVRKGHEHRERDDVETILASLLKKENGQSE